MTITTLTSREFNQDTSRAKKAAARGPVFITDRGRPAHVLLSIEAYPRQAFSNLDDVKAEAKMSAWVAGTTSLPGKSRSVVLAGQNFAVYIFAEQDGTVRKGAVVWTTIRKDSLLSFAFVANSSEQLKKLAESMKSVQFF